MALANAATLGSEPHPHGDGA